MKEPCRRGIMKDLLQPPASTDQHRELLGFLETLSDINDVICFRRNTAMRQVLGKSMKDVMRDP